MSVIFRTVERPSDPRVENSPKKYFPQLITLGQTVDLAFIAQKMQDRSSLSIGDIKSTMQNFVEKLKEQLLEGKTVNIAGLGVFLLAAKSLKEKSASKIKLFCGISLVCSRGRRFCSERRNFCCERSEISVSVRSSPRSHSELSTLRPGSSRENVR